MQPNTIVLRLDITEVNVIIKALSERPFREVYELIGKIHMQSDAQLKPQNRQLQPNTDTDHLDDKKNNHIL